MFVTSVIALAAVFVTPVNAQFPLEIEVIRDLPYTIPLNDDANEQLLDVYAPTVDGDWPAVIMFHGGSGTKNIEPMVELSRMIAERGAVVFNANILRGDGAQLYRRHENGAGVRQFIEEGVCAVRFARAMVAEYGGSGDRVIIFGHSGGGYVGLWVSLVGDSASEVWDTFAATRNGPSQQVECVANNDVSVRPDAMIGYAGAYVFFDQDQFVEDDPELQQVITPRTYIGGNPDLVLRFILGRQDRLMPDFAVEWTEQLYNDLADAGYNITWTVLEGEHMFPTDTPAIDSLMAVIGEVL
ncbi:MAG: hypothetical protein D6737_08925 [Chloroflexi bacterium]|nr:MAG: hypothetical protein D6737_08925 [Chloroflexota bacterium]